MSDNKQLTPVSKLKAIIASPSVSEQFRNAMGENSNLFVASLIDVYGGDNYLQKCDPKLVIQEALKAAVLKLPISKSLGFAYIVPYKNVPQFQLGYRGLIQLAMRTGAYKFLNADTVYEGELISTDKLTGEIDLSGERISDNIVGYFAHIETLNGFKKTMYGSVEDVTKHARRYSASFNRKTSAWQTNFDEMAVKTMVRMLLSKYGVMSVEMVSAFDSDTVDTKRDYQEDEPNGDIIDIEPESSSQRENRQEATEKKGPEF